METTTKKMGRPKRGPRGPRPRLGIAIANKAKNSQLAIAMGRAGYTAETLAKKLGVGRQTVYDWLAGRASRGFRKGVRVAQVLGVSADTIWQ